MIKVKAWMQWGRLVARWLAIRIATILRWGSVFAIAAGMGIAVAHYADEGMLPSLLFYCVLPGGMGLFLAHVFDEFGKRQDED